MSIQLKPSSSSTETIWTPLRNRWRCQKKEKSRKWKATLIPVANARQPSEQKTLRFVETARMPATKIALQHNSSNCSRVQTSDNSLLKMSVDSSPNNFLALLHYQVVKLVVVFQNGLLHFLFLLFPLQNSPILYVLFIQDFVLSRHFFPYLLLSNLALFLNLDNQLLIHWFVLYQLLDSLSQGL